MRGGRRGSRVRWPLLIVLLLFLSWTGQTAQAEKVSESSSRPPRRSSLRENNCPCVPAASLGDIAHPRTPTQPPEPPLDPIPSLRTHDHASLAHDASNLRSSQDPDQSAQARAYTVEPSVSASAPSVGADGKPKPAAAPRPDPGGFGAEIEVHADRDEFGEILNPPPGMPLGPQWAPAVSILPTELKFVETPLCQPTTHVVHVYNMDRRESFKILSLTTDAVYMQPVDFRPVEVPPGRGRRLKVAFLPRSLGGSHGSFRLLTSKGSIVISARGVGTQSPYKLQPLVGAKVPSGVPFMWRLELFNPHASMVKLVEALSSDHTISLGPPSAEDLASQARQFDQEDKVAVEKANSSDRGEVRSFPSSIWELPSKSAKIVLSVKLLAAHAGRHEGTIKLVLNKTTGDTWDKNDPDMERHELHVPVQFDSAHGGVFRSPDQIDFGIATRRLDRLRQTVTLFNSGPEPVRVMDVAIRPADPSLRIKYTKGYILPPYTEVPMIQLVYSGKLEGIRMGMLHIRVSNSNMPIEVPYRAKIQHGKLSWNEAEMSFLSPAAGRKPFAPVSNTVRVLNNFRTPLAFHAVRVVNRPPRSNRHSEPADAQTQVATGDDKPAELAGADDEEACCFEVKDFRGGQVVTPGYPLAPFTIEYTPQDKNAIFTATLELDTNLTTMEIPIEVHHGQLTCFDADQAEMRAKAAAEAAAMIAAAVVTKDAAGNAQQNSDAAAETSGDAVPCAAVAEGKKAKIGDDISQMGLIDFGVVGVPGTRHRRVAVYNPNPMPLTIKSVDSSVRSVSVAYVEVSGSSLKTPISHVAPGSLLSANHRTSHKPPPPPPRCMTAEGKNVACTQEFWSVQHKGGSGAVIVPPLHVATVHVLAAPEREETATKGALTFHLDNGRQLVAPVSIKALKGTIGVSGTDVPGVLELPPTFPGRPIKTPLKLRNDFRDTVTAAGSRSTAPTFSVELAGKKLKAGRDTTAGHVVFDPAQLPREYAYTSLGRVRRKPEQEKVADKRRSMFAAMLGAEDAAAKSKSKSRTLYPDDVDELRRLTEAWRLVAKDHGRHDAFVTQTATVLLKTDAVDPFPIEVKSALLRPSVFTVVEEEETTPPKKTMDARFQYSSAKSKTKGKPNEGQRVVNVDGVVDFGSVQLDRKSPRHRVVATNPLSDQIVCVRIMPFVAASEKSIAEIEGDVDAATIAAANLHVAGEYDPPGATGFVLDGGDISMKRKTGPGKGTAALVSDGRDTACLSPGQSVDLGVLSFKPKEVRRYHAHMCVRNNFTTLECATLSGSADAVKVYVAKKPRGTQVVTDVGFRLPTIGLGGADLITQTVHVVNRGSVAADVAKPYVGAFACGGDGSHSGYTVTPCKPFTLAPGGSKQLTVACLTDKAKTAASYSRGVAGAWTALTMEVSSPDGVKTTLTANLQASERIVTGAYAAGEMARSGPRSLIAWLATIGAGGAACWLFYTNRAALQGAYERRKKAAADAAAAAAKQQEAAAAAVHAVTSGGKKAKRRGSQDIGSPKSPSGAKSGSPKSPIPSTSMDTESSSGSSPEKLDLVSAKAPEPEPSGSDSAGGSSPALSPKSSLSKLGDEKKATEKKTAKEEMKDADKGTGKPSEQTVAPNPFKEKAVGSDKVKAVPAPRAAPSTESGGGKTSPKTTASPKVSPANSFKQEKAEITSDKTKVIPKPKAGAAATQPKQPKQQQPAAAQQPKPEQPNVAFAGKPIRTKAPFENEAGGDWITPPKPALGSSPTASEQSLLSPTGLAAEATATAAGLSVLSSPYGQDIFAAAAPARASSSQQPPLPPGPPPGIQSASGSGAPPLPAGPRPPNLRQDGTQAARHPQPPAPAQQPALGGFAAGGLGLGSIGGGASGYNMWADHFSQLSTSAAKPSHLATPDDIRRMTDPSAMSPPQGSFFGGGLAAVTDGDALEPDGGVGGGDGGAPWGLWGASAQHTRNNSDLDDNEWERKNLDLLNDLELD